MSRRPVRPDPIGHALRRGKHKTAILLALRERGPLTVAQLARLVDLRFHRVVGDLHGRFPEHLPAKSLVSVGLVAPAATPWGTRYELTDVGVAVTDELAAGERL